MLASMWSASESVKMRRRRGADYMLVKTRTDATAVEGWSWWSSSRFGWVNYNDALTMTRCCHELCENVTEGCTIVILCVTHYEFIVGVARCPFGCPPSPVRCMLNGAGM